MEKELELTSSSKAGKHSHATPVGERELDKPGSEKGSDSGSNRSRASVVELLYLAVVPPHVRKRVSTYQWPTAKEALFQAMSLVEWPYFPWVFMDFKRYPNLLFDDFLAGMTVGVILIPQGMGYALTASLDPIMGLYCGTISGYVYALLGTSGQLTIGPVALVSSFMSSTFTSLGISLDKKDLKASYIRHQLCGVLSLAVGIMLSIMGALRLGKLMKFISPSVMVGFTTGCGVYIGLTQIKYLFNVKLSTTEYYWPSYLELAQKAVQSPDVEVMKIGWSCWAVMFFFFVLKKVLAAKASPGFKKSIKYKIALFLISSSTLLILIISTLITEKLVKRGIHIPVIGQVPEGFNPFGMPKINHFGLPFGRVVVKAIPLMLLCYMESVAVARKYAIVNNYQVDPNQEMWALGMGAIVASFFTAYPPGGSFSRTALKADLGVKTPFANIFSSLLVTIVITSMTRLLRYVPMAFLGAVIDIAVLQLLDFGEMYQALWIAPVDFLVMVFTFWVTAFYNTELGLEYGILASIVVLVWQISSMDVYSVGQITRDSDGKMIFANTKRHPEAVLHSKIRVIRIVCNLFFGNVGAFRDEFYSSVGHKTHEVEAIIVDASGVSALDLTTLSVIHEMLDYAKKSGFQVYLANVSPRLIFSLEGYQLVEKMGGEDLITKPLEVVYDKVSSQLTVEPQEEPDTEMDTQGLKQAMMSPRPDQHTEIITHSAVDAVGRSTQL